MQMFQNTGGSVRRPDGRGVWTWAKLTPHMHGYIGMLLSRRDYDGYVFHHEDGSPAPEIQVAFSILSPEAMRQIHTDCTDNMKGRKPSRDKLQQWWDGASFFKDRQGGRWPDRWPPVSIFVRDGLVYLREAGAKRPARPVGYSVPGSEPEPASIHGYQNEVRPAP